MNRNRCLLTLALIALAGCKSHGPPADRILYRTSDAPSPPLEPAADRFERKAVPAPKNDIPESERIRWHRENDSDRGRYIPPYDRPDPIVHVEGPPVWDYVVPALFIGAIGWGVYHGYDHYRDCHW